MIHIHALIFHWKPHAQKTPSLYNRFWEKKTCYVWQTAMCFPDISPQKKTWSFNPDLWSSSQQSLNIFTGSFQAIPKNVRIWDASGHSNCDKVKLSRHFPTKNDISPGAIVTAAVSAKKKVGDVSVSFRRFVQKITVLLVSCQLWLWNLSQVGPSLCILLVFTAQHVNGELLVPLTIVDTPPFVGNSKPVRPGRCNLPRYVLWKKTLAAHTQGQRVTQPFPIWRGITLLPCLCAARKCSSIMFFKMLMKPVINPMGPEHQESPKEFSNKMGNQLFSWA